VQEQLHEVVMFELLGEGWWVWVWEDVNSFLKLRKKAHCRL
jgi:hypothetical protein